MNLDINILNFNELLNDFIACNEEFSSLGEKYIKKTILDNFKEDNFIIVTKRNTETLLCRKKHTSNILLSDFNNLNKSETEKRQEIVQMAAKIISEDIAKIKFNRNSYPPANLFFDNVMDDIPLSLQTFLYSIIAKNNVLTTNQKRVMVSIAHTIMTANKPRTVFSTMQIGLAATLYHRFGSKDLINILSRLGFCASYDEVLRFQSSIISFSPEPKLNPCYSQFAFDNADHNVNTIDGKNTFHSMGGIQCLIPHNSVINEPIPRISRMKSSLIAKKGTVAVETFKSDSNKKIRNYVMQSFENAVFEDNNFTSIIKNSKETFLWLYNKYDNEEITTGWNHFMETITNSMPYNKSRVICLPFISAPPSNYDTIYTALLLAARKAKEQSQEHAFVCFDQPLYIKAKDVLDSDQSNALQGIHIRLGGFHLLMSYLGAIGYIMDGSGLEKLLSEIYAEETVKHLLSGHAYSRAVRGHSLIHLALTKLILSQINFTKSEKDFLQKLNALAGTSMFFDVIKDKKYEKIEKKFKNKLNELSSFDTPTSRLWIQYYQMITLMKCFIEADRKGVWDDHLECLAKMLPIFHASGHHLYAKCGHLYLQEMLSLNINDHEIYISQGCFTIKTSEKYWSGLPTDQTIETKLMKLFKDPHQGLTHGRGTDNNDIAKWILTLPTLIDLYHNFEEFCNFTFETGEQHGSARIHEDGGKNRVERDNHDTEILLNWLIEHNPFNSCDQLMSLSTGVVADDRITCHDAFNIGYQGLKNMINKKYIEIKIPRKNRVVPLSLMSSTIKVGKKQVAIDPTLLFQRICIVKKSDEQLENLFRYELSPYPLSLFDSDGMRKSQKSVLYNVFRPLTIIPELQNKVYVIDGGYLLHRVVWNKEYTYGEIIKSYINYLNRHYPNSYIIFDGYPDINMSTKYNERMRRLEKNRSADISFTINMKPSVTQKKFLSNCTNKTNFIELLANELIKNNFNVTICKEDADTQIVNTAIKLKNETNNVIVVGQDIDLLILITELASRKNCDIYFNKPMIGKTPEQFYNKSSFCEPALVNCLFFIHAFCGCDTTSAFSKIGKRKIITILKKYPILINEIELFYNENSTETVLSAVGAKVIKALYGLGSNKNKSLNASRFVCFRKCTLKIACKLSAIPPTFEAAKLHSLRVYLQIQKWLGNDKNPLQYGWKKTENGLMPIQNNEKAYPQDLLSSISCNCKSKCKNNMCTCYKLNVKCTLLCGTCWGTNCDNGSNINTENIEFDSEDQFHNASEYAECVYDEIESSLDDSSIAEENNEIDNLNNTEQSLDDQYIEGIDNESEYSYASISGISTRSSNIDLDEEYETSSDEEPFPARKRTKY